MTPSITTNTLRGAEPPVNHLAPLWARQVDPFQQTEENLLKALSQRSFRASVSCSTLQTSSLATLTHTHTHDGVFHLRGHFKPQSADRSYDCRAVVGVCFHSDWVFKFPDGSLG